MSSGRKRKHRATQLLELHGAGNIPRLKHPDYARHHTLAIFHEPAVVVQGQVLEEKAHTSGKQQFTLIQTVREAQVSFIQQLHDLDNLLVGRGQRNCRRSRTLAQTGADCRPVDQCSDHIIGQRLIQLAKAYLDKQMCAYQEWGATANSIGARLILNKIKLEVGWQTRRPSL